LGSIGTTAVPVELDLELQVGDGWCSWAAWWVRSTAYTRTICVESMMRLWARRLLDCFEIPMYRAALILLAYLSAVLTHNDV
jgi:hypothetical protein